MYQVRCRSVLIGPGNLLRLFVAQSLLFVPGPCQASRARLMFSSLAPAAQPGLCRQGLAARFGAKGNEEQTDRERDGRHRNGNPQGSIVPHTRSHQKRDSRPAESCKGRGKSKGTRAALRWILFRQPKGINRKIGAAKSKKAEAHKKPRQRRCAQIENLAERQRDKSHHQREKEAQRPASSELFSEPRHRQAP